MSNNTKGRRTPPAPAWRRDERYLLIVGVLAVLLGLGIVARGLIQHTAPLYTAAGVVFVLFGLWRLKQWSDGWRSRP